MCKSALSVSKLAATAEAKSAIWTPPASRSYAEVLPRYWATVAGIAKVEAPALSNTTESPSAHNVVKETSKVVSQFCQGADPQGLRSSRSPVLAS